MRDELSPESEQIIQQLPADIAAKDAEADAAEQAFADYWGGTGPIGEAQAAEFDADAEPPEADWEAEAG